MSHCDPELETAYKEVRRLRALVDILMVRLAESGVTPSLMEDAGAYNPFAPAHMYPTAYSSSAATPSAGLEGNSPHYPAQYSSSYPYQHITDPSSTYATSSSSMGSASGSSYSTTSAPYATSNFFGGSDPNWTASSYSGRLGASGSVFQSATDHSMAKPGDIMVESPTTTTVVEGEAYRAGRYY